MSRALFIVFSVAFIGISADLCALSWNTPQTVDSAGYYGFYTSIALDVSGYPYQGDRLKGRLILEGKGRRICVPPLFLLNNWLLDKYRGCGKIDRWKHKRSSKDS